MSIYIKEENNQSINQITCTDDKFYKTEMCSLAEKVLSELLITYRKHRNLWDTTDPQYMNRDTRAEANQILLKVYQKLQPNATMDMMKKKLENLRTAYRRERKKFEDRKEGASVPYVPKLWYYDLLSFLNEDTPVREITDYEVCTGDQLYDEYEEEFDSSSCNMKQCVISTTNGEKKNMFSVKEQPESVCASDNDLSDGEEIVSTVPKRKASGFHNSNTEKKRRPALDASEFMTMNLNTPNDEFDTLGQVFANKLRSVAKFDYKQYLHADHLMNEVIYRALQGELARNSTIVNVALANSADHS